MRHIEDLILAHIWQPFSPCQAFPAWHDNHSRQTLSDEQIHGSLDNRTTFVVYRPYFHQLPFGHISEEVSVLRQLLKQRPHGRSIFIHHIKLMSCFTIGREGFKWFSSSYG